MASHHIAKPLDIHAPIQAVWDQLLDIQTYSSWNPFIIQATGSGPAHQPGTLLTFTVKWHNGKTSGSVEEVQQALSPSKDADGVLRAQWVYRYKTWVSAIGMIQSVRTQTLQQSPGQPTHYHSALELKGWGSQFAPLEKIERGLATQGKALKQTLEALHGVGD